MYIGILINHAWISSWNHPVLSNEVMFLDQGNNRSLWWFSNSQLSDYDLMIHSSQIPTYKSFPFIQTHERFHTSLLTFILLALSPLLNKCSINFTSCVSLVLHRQYFLHFYIQMSLIFYIPTSHRDVFSKSFYTYLQVIGMYLASHYIHTYKS